MVTDIVSAARKHPMVVFHSTDPTHSLYDFMYRQGDIFYAFQATLGGTHSAASTPMQDLRTELGTSPLEFYYMVPKEKFAAFVTTSVCPVADELTHIWHLKVPNPKNFSTHKKSLKKSERRLNHKK